MSPDNSSKSEILESTECGISSKSSPSFLKDRILLAIAQPMGRFGMLPWKVPMRKVGSVSNKQGRVDPFGRPPFQSRIESS
eukprot:scaffold9313_cov140-Amphora_coffeaeformis.AAC.3